MDMKAEVSLIMTDKTGGLISEEGSNGHDQVSV